MWPREHGAYGQLLFPLGTALAVGHPGRVSSLIAAAAIGAFLAHEPLLVLLGQRGARAAREQRRAAAIWLGAFAGASLLCGIAAFSLAPFVVRATLAVPTALAALLAVMIFLRHERTAYGEVLTAVTLSSLALPVAVAAGALPAAGLTCVAVLAAVFVSGTLGVRAVIACTRRPPARRARAVAAGTAVVGLAILWWMARAALLVPSAPWAALPVCALAVVLAAAPPSARHLRTVGWALVATTAASAVVLVATLR